jgi:hypothetical protein
MTSSVAKSKSDGYFPVATPEGARLCSPFQDYQSSCGKTFKQL